MLKILNVSTLAILPLAVGAGAAASAFFHYYRKHADGVDLRMPFVQEVVITDDETKKSRRKNK